MLVSLLLSRKRVGPHLWQTRYTKIPTSRTTSASIEQRNNNNTRYQYQTWTVLLNLEHFCKSV